MTFLLHRHGQIQTHVHGRQKCSVSLWGIRQEVSSSVYFFIHPQVTPLYPCSQYLGGPEVLRLSQINLLFCPLLQSYGGPQVRCAAGESTWSKQGERGMIEVENASSMARTGLDLLGGWKRQSCCLEGHVPTLLNKGARDCGRAESFSFRFPLLLQMASFSSYILPILLMVQSGFSVCRYSGVSHTLFLFVCIVNFPLLRVKLLSAPELKTLSWCLLSPLHPSCYLFMYINSPHTDS